MNHHKRRIHYAFYSLLAGVLKWGWSRVVMPPASARHVATASATREPRDDTTHCLLWRRIGNPMQPRHLTVRSPLDSGWFRASVWQGLSIHVVTHTSCRNLNFCRVSRGFCYCYRVGILKRRFGNSQNALLFWLSRLGQSSMFRRI